MRICPHCCSDIDDSGTVDTERVYDVLAAVETVTLVPPSETLSRSQRHNVIEARFVAATLLRELYGMTYVELGEVFNRDHTSICNAVRNVNRETLEKVGSVLGRGRWHPRYERNRDADNAADSNLRAVS